MSDEQSTPTDSRDVFYLVMGSTAFVPADPDDVADIKPAAVQDRVVAGTPVFKIEGKIASGAVAFDIFPSLLIGTADEIRRTVLALLDRGLRLMSEDQFFRAAQPRMRAFRLTERIKPGVTMSSPITRGGIGALESVRFNCGRENSDAVCSRCGLAEQTHEDPRPFTKIWDDESDQVVAQLCGPCLDNEAGQ